MNAHRRPPRSSRAFVLLEIVIALTIFSVAVLGLAQCLKDVFSTANKVNRAQAVRFALRSFLEEVRRKPVSDMTMSSTDDRLHATFASTVKPLSVTYPPTGNVLTDLYQLTATASYEVSGQPQIATVRVWVFQNQQEEQRRRNRIGAKK